MFKLATFGGTAYCMTFQGGDPWMRNSDAAICVEKRQQVGLDDDMGLPMDSFGQIITTSRGDLTKDDA